MPCQPAFYSIFTCPPLLHCSLFPIPTVPSVLSILVPFSLSNPYSFQLYQSLPIPTILKKTQPSQSFLFLFLSHSSLLLSQFQRSFPVYLHQFVPFLPININDQPSFAILSLYELSPSFSLDLSPPFLSYPYKFSSPLSLAILF